MNYPTENLKKYPDLEKLSTQALEDLLRQDLTASEDDSDSAEFILALMEVIHAREAQQPSPIDEDTAWNTFLERNLPSVAFSAPESKTIPFPTPPSKNTVSFPSETSPRKRLRWKLRVGISVAILLCLLVSIMVFTATGNDAIQDMVQWSEHLFSFRDEAPSLSPLDVVTSAQIEDAVSSLTNLPVLPTYYPKECTLTQTETSSSFNTEHLTFIFSVPDGEFSISITVSETPPQEDVSLYEKNPGTPESYYVQGIPHYIMNNVDHVIVAWQNGTVEGCIQGHLSVEVVKEMIDSIYS